MRSAVLFDIDGTLLRTSGAGAKALTHALATELSLDAATVSRAMAGVDFRGATDRSILLRLGQALGVALDRHERTLLVTYLAALDEHLQRTPVETLPGVNELLKQLETRTDVYVGILTGNFRQAAHLKLASIGHAHLMERAGAFGEDGLLRHELASAAKQRLHAQGVHEDARILVIGDTEHDVACGKHIGAYTVAVSTGWTSREALVACSPDLLLSDLSEPSALIALLNSQER
jgi:phosphoglycolate phosphatase-like HAD superfamily hydrolase